MAALFIADVHLCHEEPATVAGFLQFLSVQARDAQALYILGDLFEAWIGDDDPNPLHQHVAQALRALSAHGVPCYFIHGNRDFLLGWSFAKACGMTLLPACQRLTLYGREMLIMHGDTLCTDDAGYQAFRRKVHTPWIQRLFLALPLALRLNIARRMRHSSQQANRDKSLDIMDVNADTVLDVMRTERVQWLIHGHTHRPAIHPLVIDGVPAWRCVLGAWHTQGSYISVTADDVELLNFPL